MSRARRVIALVTLATLAAACSSDGDGGSTRTSASGPTGRTAAGSTTSAGEPGAANPGTSATTAPGAPGTPGTSAATAPAGPVTVAAEPADVTTGLSAPWSIVFVSGTALVSERDSARILELLGDGSTREIGVVADVVHGGEGGLLGLAVGVDGRLDAYSTGPSGNRIQRFELVGVAGSYALGAATTLVDALPASSNHNGGRLAFGPDGMLYASVGDAGDRELAQDPAAMNGKILRMTADGGVPPDNPFPGSLVYSYGHRNVQGFAWAPDGTMFATEFGQETWDELNVITAGANYGWPVVEGAAGDPAYVDPVQQWPTGQASPSGMVAIGATLFIANLRGEVLREVPVGESTTSTEHFAGELGRLRAVAAAPDGSLWVLTNNTDGRGDGRAGDDRILSVPVAPA